MVERHTSVVIVEAEDGSQLPEAVPEHKDVILRGVKITKNILSEFGFTEGCLGCKAAKAGYTRNHNQACRDRIE